MKAVIDTNVLVAAFATHGLCHAVFELCLDQHEIMISQEILNELGDVLSKKIKLPQSLIKRTSDYLRRHARVYKITGQFREISRDKSDDHILALAEQVTADIIITGDADLIVLNNHVGIPIVQPRQFWEIIKKTPKAE